MLFNSFEFLLFATIVIPLYFLLTHRYRWLLLLVASCLFYMYFIPVYILVLFAVIGIDYFAALQIAKATQQHKKKWLLLSLAGNLGILFFFKYYNFFIANINHLPFLHSKLHYLNIVLPIGLSFHTFQAISYTVEVYRGNQAPEKHFGIYALYVMFFPQLVAGPIERPQNMLHQFREIKTFDSKKFNSGLRLVLMGLFMKSVIADRLAIPVDTVYNNNTGQWSGLSLVVATLFFAIQIYCDFAGYSYIAVGIARCLGFNLMQNFKQPYFSKNISQFWNKWHISLSTWFKDYVYIPLGGNRVGKGRLILNLFIVFALSGLWHGANYTFIAWGLFHALLVILFTLFISQFVSFRLPQIAAIAITFFLVCIGWIFFRSSSYNMAIQMITKIFVPTKNYMQLYTNNDVHGLKGTFLGLPLYKFVYSLLLVPLCFYIDYLVIKKNYSKLYTKSKLL